MQSGKLRHRVSIQTATESLNDAGETLLSWAEYVPAWADVRDSQGMEKMQEDEPQAQVTHKVTIRHRDGITPKMRVVWSGRILNIKAITTDRTDERTQFLWCEERAGETT